MIRKNKDKVKDIDLTSADSIERSISDFLNCEYKDYVFYILANRCLPSVCDGLKTGARKILHAAINGGLKTGERKKFLNLSGDTMNLSLFAHGDSSLNGTIVTLSQEFKFNLNPLFVDGQNGSLRNPKGISSARYLYVKQSDFLDIWKTDIDITERIFDEGQYVEPVTYLPIIPVVVCNSQSGIGVGYKFYTISYNPLDIIDACSQVLKSRKKENRLDGFKIKPYIRGYDNSLWKQDGDKWVSNGAFTVDLKHDSVDITMLPYDMDFDGFEKLLNKLVEQEEIKEWRNFSKDEEIRYQIIYPKKALGKIKQVDAHIVNTFKLKKTAPDDLLWVIDENKKIRHFETVQDLVEYFTEWRLTKYDDRKSRLVAILEERLKKNSDLVKFIELVCSGKLKIRNRSKKDIQNDMDAHDLPMTLISTPMSKVTVEERDELLKENKRIKDELEYIKKATTKQMYLADLKTLRKKLETVFV